MEFRGVFSLGDLQTGLEQVLRGERPRFPAKTCSFREWAMQLNALSHTPEFLAQAEGYSGWPVTDEEIPLDFETGPAANDVQSTETVSESLEPGETKALLRAPSEPCRSCATWKLITRSSPRFRKRFISGPDGSNTGWILRPTAGMRSRTLTHLVRSAG